ncbi:helix-turn-helix domain-containing protein [Aneurinibacillus terranovensis]|uniref:helix-turn-helix domain-containing protein n=1 Tax=Aneurinibacillus terranovensis TaxID=278991 RepID=UPI00040F9197|nr:helix-turn-helix transcriptional regulator [Aneurinibacillus terranovensis]
MIEKKFFAERLQKLRIEKGIMAKDVADQIKVTKPAISIYEAGKGFPTVEKLAALADYFRVSVDYLIGRSDDPTLHSPRKNDTSDC